MDDGSVAVSVDLKKSLIPAPSTQPRPLNYHERTCHILAPENNLLQYYLDDTEKFPMKNKMKINPKKTKILTFNKSRKYDFPPELHFSIKEMLEVVSDIKLVGVILSDALRWKKNTNYIC